MVWYSHLEEFSRVCCEPQSKALTLLLALFLFWLSQLVVNILWRSLSLNRGQHSAPSQVGTAVTWISQSHCVSTKLLWRGAKGLWIELPRQKLCFPASLQNLLFNSCAFHVFPSSRARWLEEAWAVSSSKKHKGQQTRRKRTARGVFPSYPHLNLLWRGQQRLPKGPVFSGWGAEPQLILKSTFTMF